MSEEQEDSELQEAKRELIAYLKEQSLPDIVIDLRFSGSGDEGCFNGTHVYNTPRKLTGEEELRINTLMEGVGAALYDENMELNGIENGDGGEFNLTYNLKDDGKFLLSWGHYVVTHEPECVDVEV